MPDDGVFNISQNSDHSVDNDVESNDSQVNLKDIDDNVNVGDVNQLGPISFTINETGLSTSLAQESKDSVSFSNPKPATGGSSGETVRETRENALAYFQSQQRAVTKDDYIVRAYSLPPKYGTVA